MPPYQKELLSRAMQAPAHVDRVEGADGVYASIMREGTSARRFEVFGPDGAMDSRTWEFGPAPERSATYPADLPFVADMICTTTESSDRRLVSWFAETPNPNLADLKDALSGIDFDATRRPAFSEVLDGMKKAVESGAPPPSAAAALSEAFGIDEAQARDIGARVFAPPAPEAVEKLEAAFEQILAELTEAGWELGVPHEVGAGPFSAGVSLALGEAGRFLFRTSIAGVGYIMLQDVTSTSIQASSG